MIKKTMFICMLSEKLQEIVREKVKAFQISIGSENLEKDIENVMDGRLCDLEDDINMKELIKELEEAEEAEFEKDGFIYDTAMFEPDSQE